MKVYVARHAETNYNEQGLVNYDRTVDVHLTKQGIAQAEELAGKLKSAKFDLIITSQLPRTRQTADIVNKYHQVPIISDCRLDDICCGFEGRSVADYREAKANALDLFTFKIDGDAESFLDVQARTKDFLRDLAKRGEENILVVTSNHNVKQIYGLVNRLSNNEIIKMKVANAAYFEFEKPDLDVSVFCETH